jgi:ABC-type Fe3+ transport system permease subunit
MSETIYPLFNGIFTGIFPLIFSAIFALPVALVWFANRSDSRTRAIWTLATALPLFAIHQLVPLLAMLNITLPPKSDARFSISILLYMIAMYVSIRFRQTYPP